jgi:hypothetical protein
MKKKEVELILIIVKSAESEALNMKIYKNGIICRRGCGGLPEIGISAMSFTDSSTTFDKLIDLVPEEILEKPISYLQEQIENPLEYLIAFYGVSKNGETGERAEWTKSTGIRLLIDTNTTFKHPILSFVDSFSLDAAELSNSWYFDIMINVVYKLKSTTLPQTILATPKTDKEIQNDFENYVTQIRFSSRQWDLASFAKGKIYSGSNNIRVKPNMTQKGDVFNINFTAIENELSAEITQNNAKKKWWKAW